MESDQSNSKRRVVRFKPKAPPREKRKSRTAKPKEEEVDEANAQELIRVFNESEARRKQKGKVEDSIIKPTFSYGAKQPAPFTGFSVPRYGVPNDDSDSDAEEYKEPWDYNGSVYPTTLPWRRPYSGDPDVLDEFEFGEAAIKTKYNENGINDAAELGFLDSNESRMLLFQLPTSLPLVKRASSARGKEKEGTSTPPTARVPPRNCGLGELPTGHMGKLYVYKSGAVKLKLGHILYDVSSGSGCSFAQEVVSINFDEKKCFSVGDLPKKAVVTPDIDSIFDSLGDRD